MNSMKKIALFGLLAASSMQAKSAGDYLSDANKYITKFVQGYHDQADKIFTGVEIGGSKLERLKDSTCTTLGKMGRVARFALGSEKNINAASSLCCNYDPYKYGPDVQSRRVLCEDGDIDELGFLVGPLKLNDDGTPSAINRLICPAIGALGDQVAGFGKNQRDKICQNCGTLFEQSNPLTGKPDPKALKAACGAEGVKKLEAAQEEEFE